MTFFDRRPASRWLLPLLAALLLTAGVSAVGALSASASGKLAPRSAARLLVDVQRARLSGLSGTLVQNADLGLPSLPGIGSTGSSDLTSLVSGSHTLRLWTAGPDHVRLSLMGSLGESDVIRNGTSLWTWSSSGKTATHRALPATSGDSHPSTGQGPAITPQQAADEALKAIDPSTRVSTDGTTTVADRPAYELLLQPRDSSSLVDSVRIAIDSATRIPTRVQVFAKGATSPAFEVAFTSFDPTTPSASVFRFDPPPGTKVTEEAGSAKTTEKKTTEKPSTSTGAQRHQHAASSADSTRVVGSGWASVLVATLPKDTSSSTSRPGGSSGPSSSGAPGLGSLAKTLSRLPTVSGGWGSGHLLQGALFSAVLTDDGRVAVGAVPPSALYAALTR